MLGCPDYNQLEASKHMKLKIEQNKEGRYRAPEDPFNLTFDTEWEARAFYLEVEMGETWAMHGDDPSMRWDWFLRNWELRLYKGSDWCEKHPGVMMVATGIVSIVAGLVVGYNI